MLRRLYTVLSFLSLLLCVVVVFACFSSYFAFAPFGQYWETRYWETCLAGGESTYRNGGWLAKDGSLHFVGSGRKYEPASPIAYWSRRRSGVDPAPGLQLEPTRFGFANFHRASSWGQGAGTNFQRVTDTNTQLSFPLWMLALLLALPTVGRLVAGARRRKRRARGLCPSCGYDLRATPGRCPECGAASPAAG
jgi:hypothetical protein